MNTSVEAQFKILIVDDEKDNLDIFMRRFGKKFALVTAGSAAEALVILEKDRTIAVVVSDQRMPKMSGVQLLEMIKVTYPEIVRILLTGYTDLNVAVDAINKGFVYKYIQKPIEEESTFEILSDALGEYVEHLNVRQFIEDTKKRIKERFIEIYESIAAGIAHHINNGLVPARTFFDLLDMKLETIKQGQYDEEFFGGFLAQVLSDFKKVQEITQMILWVRNCKVEHFSNAEISDLVGSDKYGLKELLEKRKITVEKNINEDFPPVVVDRMKMEELFCLLIKNCAAVSPLGSKVKVVANEMVNGSKHSLIRVQIIHEGPGYAPEEIPKLFDPFYKYDKKLDIGVNGLELTNCYIIAAKHGSEIKVESQPGKKTVFTIELPAAK